MPSLEKLCQAVTARNDEANSQPTLNKGAGGASFTIFVTDCLQNWKNLEKDFLKTQEGLPLKEDYIAMIIS